MWFSLNWERRNGETYLDLRETQTMNENISERDEMKRSREEKLFKPEAREFGCPLEEGG